VGCYDFWLEECRCNVSKSYELNFKRSGQSFDGGLHRRHGVKSVGFEEHMTDLKLTLERMKKYGLWMNPLKCTFGVTSERFLRFIVHEHGIQIDPKKIKSIGKIGEPVCKKYIQKLLGKINYLRHFISNLAGRVDSLLPLVWLKHEEEFT
jgi:hypothetical protein